MFNLNKMDLYSWNKDMLIYLICIMRDRYKAGNMDNEKLLDFGKSYTKEIFRRKTEKVKEYWCKKYIEFKSVIDEISSMNVRPMGHVVLSILFKGRKLVVRTTVNLGYKIYLITFDNKFLYEYYSGIASIPETSNYHELRVEENEKYIDFIKFLHREGEIVKIISYFDISVGIDDFSVS